MTAITRMLVAATVNAGALLAVDVPAAIRSPEKVMAEPIADAALVYFIRERTFVGAVRTMFLYADDRFLGTVENDCSTFAHVEPGTRMIWTNWARISRTFELEAGKTYWIAVGMDGRMDRIPEEDGRHRLARVASSCTPEDEEVASAPRHIAERRGKAEKHAARETAEHAPGAGAREAHIGRWPVVDLSGYSILVVEDFRMTDPKAPRRKDQDMVEWAPRRMAERVRDDLDPGTFAEVRRGALATPEPGALVLRVEITQYKPGSEVARAMVAGAGAARLDLTVHLVDGTTGREIATFSDERAYAWGGAAGMTGGMSTLERNIAYELATWLERCRGSAS